MTLAGFMCHVCGAEEVGEVAEYARLPRVTSDCKPFPAGGNLAVCRHCGAVQKPADARWRQEAASIYRDYGCRRASALMADGLLIKTHRRWREGSSSFNGRDSG